MSARSNRELTVRRMMEGPTLVVPPEVTADALRRGGRLLRRRRAMRRAMWTLLCAGAVAFTVWAILTHPWVEPPSQTTPPVTGW